MKVTSFVSDVYAMARLDQDREEANIDITILILSSSFRKQVFAVLLEARSFGSLKTIFHN
jgi:hypothetical protein